MGRFIQDGTGIVVSVDDSKDERFQHGWKPYVDGDESSASDGAPSKSWKIDELREFAAANDIDLSGATKKDEILAVIIAAGEQGDESSASDES